MFIVDESCGDTQMFWFESAKSACENAIKN